jgi:UDP-N-acetylglucosamine/UDP-N-acetylgalactosamine diphosphorylase
MVKFESGVSYFIVGLYKYLIKQGKIKVEGTKITDMGYAFKGLSKETGYSRILEVVNVGGQELSVIAEEKINTDLIEPDEVIIPSEKEKTEAGRIGDEALKSGKVGLITVGGGMSSRAGIVYPKGETPISPLSKKTLYQCMAEELLAARAHYGKVVPWYIMTSKAMGNDESTRKYFKENNYFGLGKENVIFIIQENVGAFESGTVEGAMSGENEELTAPNGHGGIYKAMRDPKARSDGGRISALDDAGTRGVDTFLYTHVDNALPVINSTLLGLHVKKGADYTTTLVKKRDPKEGLAMAAIDKITGRKIFIEYNQPAADIIKNKEGFEYGSINRNIFSHNFLSSAEDPPFHIAVGKKARIYKDGEIQDGKIDKFERFVFDNFSLAGTAICVGLPREECFAAFKELTGPDSPEAIGIALSNYDKMLITKALKGVIIPGTIIVELPRMAHFLAPEELAKKLNALHFKDFLKEGANIIVSDDFGTIYSVNKGVTEHWQPIFANNILDMSL